MLKLVPTVTQITDGLLSRTGKALARYFNRAAHQEQYPDVIALSEFEQQFKELFEHARDLKTKPNVFLAWINEDKTKTKFSVIPMGKNPWDRIHILDRQGKSLIAALDLNKDFIDQWPATTITKPSDLLHHPLITIPLESDVQPVYLNNPIGHGRRQAAPFIRGIVTNPTIR